MKTPVCLFCAKSGILCPKCQEKLEKGEISYDDVEVTKWFIEYESKNPQLKDCILQKTVNAGDLLIVMISCGGKISRALLNKISKQMSIDMKKDVRLIEKTSSIKRLMEQMVYPARVIGANTVWLPDGSWESIIRIPKIDKRKIPMDSKLIEETIKKLTGEMVHLVFE